MIIKISGTKIFTEIEEAVEAGKNDRILEHEDATVEDANLLCFFAETGQNMEPLVVRRFLCKPQSDFLFFHFLLWLPFVSLFCFGKYLVLLLIYFHSHIF
jgi:hypothetical protein